MNLFLSGRCLCGDSSYAGEAEPIVAAHCQCRDCQRNTGTGHSSHVGVPASALRVSGKVRTYELTAASGNVASRGFCPRCGSPVFFTTSGLPDVIFLAAGSLDDPALFEPSVVVFAASAQPWDIMDPALQRFPRMPE